MTRARSSTSRSVEVTRHTYLDLFVNAPIAFLTLDRNGRIGRVNHATVDLLDETVGRLTGHSFDDFIVDTDVESWHDHLRDAKSSHHPATIDVSLVVRSRLIAAHAVSTHLADDGECTMTALIDLGDVTPRAKVPGRDGRDDAPASSVMSSTVIANGTRVLLVEDDEDLRNVTAHLLRREQYDVWSVGTLAEALRAATVEKFEVVISDLRLPDGSGLDLMRGLLALDADLKGVALSGYCDADEALDAGYAAHLRKPVDIADLSATLRQLG
jgi:two-component system response regulator PilR (NtrC family)